MSWEKRSHSTGFANTDTRRALNTLRYIPANPKAAGTGQGFFYGFSNYGIHDRLGDDGITQWHPAFLALGKTLDECAAAYRKFCQKYRPKPKSESKNHWGSRLLVGLKVKGKSKKVSPGKMCLPWGEWLIENPEILAVAEKFILANCYNPQIAGQILQQTTVRGHETDDSQCQVSET
ncbi:hypothetical protein AVDCRST_MAG84-2448 [uncultured Microcoleus sp.]|uniref:Uncharacterized protein n=1 Tax=uncultured Microcoleus sp. TaxID=259945 RepID=A0A6J4LUS9_9CYAN|nr:hypothetical protein AVDCRST_MAG84-2448 [uncultured Microcoleus sp.]